jgi:hypothetical protein
MRSLAIPLLLLLFLRATFSYGSDRGSVCVAPVPATPPSTAATPELACHSGNLSLKIDKQQTIPWPQKESIKIEGLDPTLRHRVTVMCDAKPQQSFTFRVSEFKREPCLFINDLYQTAQLWESKQSPWCKCK